MVEDNGTEKPYAYDLIHNNSNDLISCTYNRKRSVQYTNEYESSSHTPKRNRVEASEYDIELERHPSKLNQNKQRAANMSAATTTISSYFNNLNLNMGDQPKKSSNNSSTRSLRESPRQTFPPFRITLEDVNRYPTTELGVVKERKKYCKLNLMAPSYFWSHFNPIMTNKSEISSCEKPFYA